MGWFLGWLGRACLLDLDVTVRKGVRGVEGLGQQAALFDRGGSCGDLDESGGKPSALQVTVLECAELAAALLSMGLSSLVWVGGG